jgi:hypothetical protein
LTTVDMVERAVARNLLDYTRALLTVAPDSRAEAVACAGGVAAFLGPGSPLTAVKGAGPDISDADIDAAETVFCRCGAEAAVFELASWVSATALERFSRRGYEVVGSEEVVVRHPPFDARSQESAAPGLPQPDRPVIAAARDQPPVSRKRDGIDHASMTRQCRDELAARRLPHPNRRIRAAT